jgi:uncharacterized protein (DUF305 family)
MTTRHTLAVFITTSFLALAAPAFAQDTSSDGRLLPEICKTTDAMKMDAGMKMDSGTMDQAHKDLMAGMDQMNSNMNEGMMAKDVDVAFVCGMIPHHQGAIDMAKAELAHGDDQWAKDMAQKVIDAQEQEIKDMKAWLAKQAK